MKMTVRPMIIERGMLRSGRLVSSTSGQTNSAPTKPHTASAVRVSTPAPMGFQSPCRTAPAVSVGAPSTMAARPMASSTIIITTARAVCSLAKMSMPSRLSTVNRPSTPKATLKGGNTPG
ncbi:hypothetical protein D3C72_2053020 [compost metagenome]